MKIRNLKTLIYLLIFGTMSGIIVTYAVSVFIPLFFTEWAGSLVCPGRVDYVTFKQTYYCYTAPNSSFDLRDTMFWAVFKRLIIPVTIVCCFLAWGFARLAEFLYLRRAAAGF